MSPATACRTTRSGSAGSSARSCGASCACRSLDAVRPSRRGVDLDGRRSGTPSTVAYRSRGSPLARERDPWPRPPRRSGPRRCPNRSRRNPASLCRRTRSPTASSVGSSARRCTARNSSTSAWASPPLAVFASDNLSSSAYATEEILHVLLPVAGVIAFSLVMPITIAMCVVLGFLILSYRETIKEYPSAGGRLPGHEGQLRPDDRPGRRRAAADRLHPHGGGVVRRRHLAR